MLESDGYLMTVNFFIILSLSVVIIVHTKLTTS